jgi:hypothetical protein
VVKRRSFEEGLSADQEAFLKQGRVAPAAPKPKPKPRSKPQPKKEEPNMSKPALKPKIIEKFPGVPQAAPSSPTPAMWGNLSVRIDQRIAAAILRAVTERKIEGIVPTTQQDIVADAMVDWLKKHGYFR